MPKKVFGISIEAANLCNPASSLTPVVKLLLFLGMKNNHGFRYVAERSVGRTRYMVPAQLEKTIQRGMKLRKRELRMLSKLRFAAWFGFKCFSVLCQDKILKYIVVNTNAYTSRY